MNLNLNDKTLRIVEHHHSDKNITTKTVFRFEQSGNIVSADYAGGGIRHGKLVGVAKGNKVKHRFVQVTHNGEIQSGTGEYEVRISPAKKLLLRDTWHWDDGGSSELHMEEARA